MSRLTRNQIIERAKRDATDIARQPITSRQKMLMTVRAYVKFVADQGPEATRLRGLAENREQDEALPDGARRGTTAVVDDATITLATPQLDFIAANVFSELPGIGNLKAAPLSPPLLERVNAYIADTRFLLRDHVEFSAFFEHHLDSRGLARLVNKTLNTARKRSIRRSTSVRSGTEDQQQLSSEMHHRLDRYTRQVSTDDPVTGAAKLEAAERLEAYMKTLAAPRWWRQRKAVEMLLDGASDSKINEESKLWTASGRGIAKSNVAKLRRRLQEILSSPATDGPPDPDASEPEAEAQDALVPDAAEELEQQEAAERAEAKGDEPATPEAVTDPEKTVAAITTDRTLDIADLVQTDQRSLGGGNFLTTVARDAQGESSQRGASRRRVMRGDVYTRQFSDGQLMRGAGGRAELFIPLPPTPDLPERPTNWLPACGTSFSGPLPAPGDYKTEKREQGRDAIGDRKRRVSMLQGYAIDGLERDKRRRQEDVAQKIKARKAAVQDEKIAKKELRGADLRLRLAGNEAELAELRTWAEPFCKALGCDIDDVLRQALHPAANDAPKSDGEAA
jgi:hypothetical protein